MVNATLRLRWQDVLDVLVVSFVLHKVFSFIKETRAVHLIRGFLLLVIIYFIANNFLELKILTSALQNATTLVIVAIPVLFQPELRRALSELGRGLSVFPTDRGLKGKELFTLTDKLVDAAAEMSETKTGALIVLERKIGLNEYIENGVEIDSALSHELLLTLFFPGTPLHDGAVVVRGERIIAASVVLPLTETLKSPAGTYWGTRHRAAMGITEVSDAACIVVSEETGNISVIMEGKVHRNLTEESLRKRLLEIFQMNTPAIENTFTRLLFRNQPQEPPKPGEVRKPNPISKLLRRAGGLVNLRVIAVMIAVIWGMAIGLGTPNNAPRPTLSLETQHRDLLLPVTVVGNADGFKVQIEPSQVNLRLVGKSDELAVVDPATVRITADISALPPGESIVPLTVAPPPNVQFRDLNPRQIKVRVIKLQPGAPASQKGP
jgi:diadenylate cyclase